MRPSPLDLHLFAEGTNTQIYASFGAHLVDPPAGQGVAFAIWAPNARAVAVVGEWDAWISPSPCAQIDHSGVWTTTVGRARTGHRYKYQIQHADGSWHDKADPVATASEPPPGNASIITASAFEWTDDDWLTRRASTAGTDGPLSVYEVHLGSWRRDPSEPQRVLSYRELAPMLAQHCIAKHFTHVEFMPLMEHPFTGSWGYQVTGFFSPTSRHGSPDDLRWCINHLHQHGIGVILDWVPAHFPDDPHALSSLDGTSLYEHADPRQGRHPDWGTLIFNYGRNEVRSFLRSNARYWLEQFHADGLRVDAVASMLYLDYSRSDGAWLPNALGGRENLEAISLLADCASDVHEHHPGAFFIAEESTTWPGVTAPRTESGLGFTHKWDLGWMNDTLTYLHRDPVHRRWHQQELTFRAMYARSETFLLPLSHDEVVHGKGSLLAKMPGDEWQQAANLRLLHGLHHATPGKKLLFMGGEFGQRREWNHDASLDWHLLDDPVHAGIERWVTHLNELHRKLTSLHSDSADDAFEWIDCDDHDNSVLSWFRGARSADTTMVIVNCTPTPHPDYRIGCPTDTTWKLIANSDDARFGGSAYSIHDVLVARQPPLHNRTGSVSCSLPPLSVSIYQQQL